MTTNRSVLLTALTVLVLISALVSYFAGFNVRPALGSTITGQDYIATTTAPTNLYGSTISGDTLIKAGQGSLGSLIVTGANTGIINMYDATTTDITKRGGVATSTIHLASIPASMATGVYVFDVQFTRGLYLDYDSGNMPTTTITYR